VEYERLAGKALREIAAAEEAFKFIDDPEREKFHHTVGLASPSSLSMATGLEVLLVDHSLKIIYHKGSYFTRRQGRGNGLLFDLF
jgi:hypothetical protein